MEIQTIDTKSQIRQMEKGQLLQFPLERMYVIRQYAYELGMLMGREYHTAIDKEKKIIEVSRIA